MTSLLVVVARNGRTEDRQGRERQHAGVGKKSTKTMAGSQGRSGAQRKTTAPNNITSHVKGVPRAAHAHKQTKLSKAVCGSMLAQATLLAWTRLFARCCRRNNSSTKQSSSRRNLRDSKRASNDSALPSDLGERRHGGVCVGRVSWSLVRESRATKATAGLLVVEWRCCRPSHSTKRKRSALEQQQLTGRKWGQQDKRAAMLSH